jgi:hypothetical protein
MFQGTEMKDSFGQDPNGTGNKSKRQMGCYQTKKAFAHQGSNH